MPTEPAQTPLAQADQQLREEIEAHRAAMSEIGKRRAALVANAVNLRGRTGVAEVADELGLSQSAVRRLIGEARKAPSA
jgi:DNA-binding MurR/RpiR family transcriptional regulator